ncbi:MAG: hypothetical protein J7621_07570 [Niastella sp.]|nr:hypothetical protein [Niastella sp.]
MEQLPLYIPVAFIATSLLTWFFLYKSSRLSQRFMIIIAVWLALQAVVSLLNFYKDTQAMPPRLGLAIGIPVLSIIGLFITQRGRTIIDSWDVKWLTWLHVVRVPVELTLYWLFLYKQIPQLMTFEGVNYDILSGITAPVMVLLCLGTPRIRRMPLLIWNFICLALLFNIVIRAILAAPTPFQQLAFDQPNVAVLYFPYIWLPAFIVPAVLLSHLIAIRRLIRKNGQCL